MTYDWKQYGIPIAVTSEMIADYKATSEYIAREMSELMLDFTVGPRYGPPVPRPEREYCDCCGQEIRDD